MGEGNILTVGRIGANLEAGVVFTGVLEGIVELELVIGDHFGLTVILVLEGTTLQAYDGIGGAGSQGLECKSARVR